MAFELPPLPYAQDALTPYISAETLAFHYGKHHQTYVTNLNNLTKDGPLAETSLEDVIMQTADDPAKAGLFNNAAQVWNHTFYWNGMTPGGGGAPTGDVAAAIVQAFGSYEAFCTEFKNACVTQFGSGWGWLVADNSGLAIMKTGNAELPMTQSKTALLTCDVWEHAYYIDYQNRRPDYVQTYLDHLVNWDFVAANLASHRA